MDLDQFKDIGYFVLFGAGFGCAIIVIAISIDTILKIIGE